MNTSKTIKMENARLRADNLGGVVLNYSTVTNKIAVAFDGDQVYLYHVDRDDYRNVPGRSLMHITRNDLDLQTFHIMAASLVNV